MKSGPQIFWIALCVVPPVAALLLLARSYGLISTDMLTHPATVSLLGGVVAGCVLLGLKRKLAAQENLIPWQNVSTLNVLSDGVLILDTEGKIVVANRAFAELLGQSPEDLQGRPVEDLPWQTPDADEPAAQLELPWSSALRTMQAVQATHVELNVSPARRFLVNAIPLHHHEGALSGLFVGFEEVTRSQDRRVELTSMLETLRKSLNQIRIRNAELERLSTRDVLTNCYNRRTFFDFFERYWTDAWRHGEDLSCLMIDLDNFRLLNEEHGQKAGDEILSQFGTFLLQSARDLDIVSRFSGDEFCLLLPGMSLDEAKRFAERLRHLLHRQPGFELGLTASFGISSLERKPRNPQELLDQADLCLTYAKSCGRNQVHRHDQLPADFKGQSVASAGVTESVSAIPFPAVTALISALSFRDSATAAHCRRVADLCVAVGGRMMSMSGCYLLETAALLHDIGKIGVPDSILMKPGQLTPEELQEIRTQDRVSVEIIRTSFASPELTAIVDHYTRRYEDSIRDSSPIPLGARILAIADAYDSMVNEQVYRTAVSQESALEELARCAGTQFDPEIVSQFIEIMSGRGRDTTMRITVGRDAALAMGMELERLARAVDQQDLEALAALAGRLSSTAAQSGAPEIAAKSLELEAAATAGTDQLGVLRCANELLAYCRATQTSYMEALQDRGHITALRALSGQESTSR